MVQFGLSQPVRRREDVRLLTGRGRFVDDLVAPDLVHAQVLRSPYAHAEILSIDTAAARATPGVLAVYTGSDVERAGIGDIPTLMIPQTRGPFVRHGQPPLAKGRVRYVGEPVAFVVAETTASAKDAVERIEMEWNLLDAVVAADAATHSGAPQLWDDAPGNVSFVFELGDASATEAAFARAAEVVTLDVVNNRIILNAIETRGVLATLADGRIEVVATTQMPNRWKDQLVEHVLKTGPDDVRVLVHDVGGGFGGKNGLYPEGCMAAFAARDIRRPVKWVADRSEAFLADTHGRDNITRGELALDRDGNFLALRVRTFANLGAYNANGSATSPINVHMAPNCYRTPAVHIEVTATFTNTMPTDPYRGAGRPEITYLVERLVDAAARRLGRDPAELRRQNFIPPDAFPYRTPTGLTYESADFAKLLDEARRRVGWDDMARRRAQARDRGRLRGIGLCTYIERCGGGGGLAETARVAVDEAGKVTVYVGSQSNGQAHETAYSQIVSEWLGVPFEAIEIVQGDTDRVPTGLGTGGSWSIPMGGGAIAHAADKVIEKGRRVAAHLMEAAEADIEFREGSYRVAGTDLSVTLSAVARAAHDPAALPEGVEPGLDERHRFAPENYTFPYGAHICEVEVDPETGRVEIVAYTIVHDFGRTLNPLLLAGQVHGGVAQGIGQAAFERTVYADDGQLLTGSYMDYCLPRADDLPEFACHFFETPTGANPLGVKGCGEAGATGAPPAVVNAVLDALAPLGVEHVDMPVTPEAIWRSIRSTKRSA